MQKRRELLGGRRLALPRIVSRVHVDDRILADHAPEHDHLTRGIEPVERVRRNHHRIPGAELRLFEGGHMFMVQDRTATPAIIEFLEST